MGIINTMPSMLNPFNWLSNDEQSEKKNRPPQIDDVDNAIRRATLIDKVNDTRSRKTDRLAVSTLENPWAKKGEDRGIFASWKESGFQDYMRFNIEQNKVSRIQDFRRLAKEEKLEACIHEIAISCLASHDDQPCITAKLVGDYSGEITDIVNDEMQHVIDFFELENRGQKYFKEFLVTGELCFENVFSMMKPELGILDVKSIPPENMDPIYRNQYNDEIEAFQFRKPNNLLDDVNRRYMTVAQTQSNSQSFTTIPMACSQVTYCNSGEWDESMKNIVPYIVKGQSAQKKLSLIEDSIVINAMVNAPERLLWSIPVGKMDPAAQDRYMRNIINGHKRKKGTDGDGNILDRYDPISITEDIYIPKRGDQSAEVTRLAGSSAFQGGFNGMLEYFHQKVYEDMHVPVTRLNPETNSSDGQTITMQELAFAERVISIQKTFAEAIKKTIIAHLKLKGLKIHHESCMSKVILESKQQNSEPPKVLSEAQKFQTHLMLVESGYYSENVGEELLHKIGMSYWDQYQLRESDIEVKFSLPTSFMALRDQQKFDLEWTNFNNMAGSGFFSVFLLAKEKLGFTDDDILRHIEWKKKEAEKNWEISQIEEGGPEFRENMANEVGLGDDMMGGDDMMPDFGGGGMGGGDSELPDFGGGDVGGDEGGDMGGEEGAEPDLEMPEPPASE